MISVNTVFKTWTCMVCMTLLYKNEFVIAEYFEKNQHDLLNKQTFNTPFAKETSISHRSKNGFSVEPHPDGNKTKDNGRFNFNFAKHFEIVKLNITNFQNDKILQFNAFGIHFVINLKHDHRPKIIGVNMAVHFQNHVWSGKRLSEVGISLYKEMTYGYSSAHGIITGQTFDGYVHRMNQTFYIEPFHKYTLTSADSCIVYRQEDLLSTQKSVDKLVEGIDIFERNFNWDQFVPMQKNPKLEKKRMKRSVTSSKSCTLHVVADHTFYQTVGKHSVDLTVSEILFMVANADRIFRSTDFNGDGLGDNTGFTITDITIYSDISDIGYKMSNEHLSVYDYLDLLSLYNFDEYCLGVAFAHRDFQDGIVGLAWVGSSNSYGGAGGICQPQVRLFSSNSLYSFNTGLVTTLNYNKHIPSYLAALTLAHELGHSFGSSHDEVGNSLCAPDDEYGNYIMFPYSSDGSKPNHDKFSSCSVNKMYPVIINKGSCMVVSTGPVCGNAVVEDGEECDCGNTKTCDLRNDACCTPSDSITNDLPCHFRKTDGKVCSPHHSPCCSKNCTFIPASDGIVCASSTSCRQEIYCNGSSAECPEGIHELDGTPCDYGRKACKLGLCIEHICTANGLKECQCNENSHLCMLCCQAANLSACLPAYSFGIKDPRGTILYNINGEPCKNFTGICDGMGNCVSRDTESTKNRLMKVFDKENMKDIEVWMKNYWYYLAISVVAVAFFVFIFVVTKRKLDSSHMDAYRMGRLLRVVYEANIEKEKQRKMLLEIDNKVNEKIRKLQIGAEHKELTAAVATLHQLFPTAPLTLLTKVAKQCTSEDVAVRLILAKSYPIRAVVSLPPPSS